MICLLVAFFINSQLSAANARIYGYVVNSENKGLEFVNVYIKESATAQGSLVGTTTNRNGLYDLIYPAKDSFVLVWSLLGYQTIEQKIVSPTDILNVNVIMTEDTFTIEGVEVRAIRHTEGMLESADMSVLKSIPSMSGSDIESILITFAGVNQNNELSTQYNVRGGNFDENQVYVNGMEIRRPLLIRSGQQEGLSFVNPNMVSRVDFSAGGYGVKFGDKMSSVLDIEYKHPKKFESSATLSLLGADFYLGTGNEKYSQMHGIRYKTTAYMLGGLPTEGSYNPNFLDYQTFFRWRLTKNNKWSMTLIGDVSQNIYKFTPSVLDQTFGGMNNAQRIKIVYDGLEKDRFLTTFGAISLHGQPRKDILLHIDLSGFYSYEKETYDITSHYNLSAGMGNADDTVESPLIASGIQHQHVRNLLKTSVVSAAFSGDWQKDKNTLSYGISGQWERIQDNISEWEWRDSAGYSLPYENQKLELYYALRGKTNMNSVRLQGYIEDCYKFNFTTFRLLLTGGLRFNWWTFTKEFLPSPRASLVFIPKWKQDIVFRIGTGLYFQAPFYKELRDTLTENRVTQIALNDKLKVQRSVHVVLGTDYYFRIVGRPFKFTAEAYYKHIDRMVSYMVDNVKIRYSGKNDAYGFITGLDAKLFGELVPGVDSWVNFSLMAGRYKYLNIPTQWLRMPSEQRYSFSMLFQDYYPKFPQLVFHLKFIWSDQVPFAAPGNAFADPDKTKIGSYRRMDLGLSYVFEAKTAKFMRQPSAKHIKRWAIYFEIFNVVDWKNTISYMWLTDALNTPHAVPNYLTGRRYNVKISVNFQ